MNKRILNVILAITLAGGLSLANAANYSSFGPVGIRSLMLDPSNNGVALAEAGYGLYKSTDNGSSWTNIPFSKSITNITMNPNDGRSLLAQAFSLSGGGIYKSADGGNSWTNTMLPTTSNSWQYSGFGYDAANSNIVYTSIRQVSTGSNPDPIPANGASIYKSTDGGSSWSVLSSMGNNFSLNTLNNSGADKSSITSLNGTIFAGNMKSVDGGNTWQGLSSDNWINSMFIKSYYIPSATENLIFATTNGGVINSSDGGVTWSHSSLGSDQSNSIIRDNNNTSRYFVTGMGGRLYESTDNAKTWSIYAQLPTMIEYANLEMNSSGDSLYVLDGMVGSGGFKVSIAAVPEPETYSMFLMGLGLMGFVIRRRKLSLDNVTANAGGVLVVG